MKTMEAGDQRTHRGEHTRVETEVGVAEGTGKAETLSGGSPPQARVDGTGLPDSNGGDGSPASQGPVGSTDCWKRGGCDSITISSKVRGAV